MSKIIFNSLIVLAILILAGLPLVILVYRKLFKISELPGIIVLALSLISGLGISAFASNWSYGAFGIKNYFNIFLLVTLLLWFGLIAESKLRFVQNLIFEKKDFLIFIPITIALYLTSTQWGTDLDPVIKVGEGPDVPQNIMAAQSAQDIGDTWLESRSRIQNTLGVNTFEDSARELFKIPNAAELAAYDYLLFGVRWGLTVPYSQINRIFGPENALLEVGTVLLVSLLSLAIIFFAIGTLFSKKLLVRTLLPITIIANSTLMQQYLNGGLSQILGAVSLSGVILVLVLIIIYPENLKKNTHLAGLVTLISLGLMGSLVTYIDSLFILFVSAVIFALILVVINFALSKKLILIMLLSSMAIIALIPSSIYTNYVNFLFRLKAAGGTGTAGEYWSFPSVHFGFANSYAGQALNKNHLLIAGMLTFIVIVINLHALFKSRSNREFAAIGVAGFITIILSFYLSLNSNNGTTYIYDKVTLYVTPLIILALFAIVGNYELNNRNLAKLILQVPYILSLITLFGGINFINGYFTVYNKTTVPYAIYPVLANKSIQQEFEDINYLMPYKPTYNFGPVLGAKYWISKAPNDFDLSKRENRELRLFCFIGDQSCNPLTPKIPNTFLEKYGIMQFASPISTAEFMQMSIDDRYQFNFEVFGMEVLEVPDKFKGGNPYYK